MKPGADIEERVAALRAAFDAAFAAPLAEERTVTTDLLALRFGERRFAVPVAELSGVETRRTIARIPSAPAHCLGVAGVRGHLVAAYDLASMLGAPRPERAPWLLVSRLDPELGFATVEAERYLRVVASSILRRDVPPDDPCVGALSYESSSYSLLSVDRLVRRASSAAGAR